MFANVDALLELNPEPIVEINPRDAEQRGICDGDQVVVYNDRARTKLKAAVSEEEKEIAEKCNLCVHRIDEGLEPFCVVCCEGQAIYFGDLNDPETKAGRLKGSEITFQLMPEQGTGPSVFYCPQLAPRGV